MFEGISILCRHAKSVANVRESSLKRYPADHFRHTRMPLNKNDLLLTHIWSTQSEHFWRSRVSFVFWQNGMYQSSGRGILHNNEGDLRFEVWNCNHIKSFSPKLQMDEWRFACFRWGRANGKTEFCFISYHSHWNIILCGRYIYPMWSWHVLMFT